VRADSVDDLRTLLQTGRARTIMTTIQKFLGREGENQGEFPELSRNENIFVLVDEAHRSQYQNLATNMRTALPNACFIGFTGTPIDRKDRSTPGTFGPYIDRYTIEQSVEDGATVEIRYESRLPNVRVEGESLDDIFNRVFKDYSEKEQAEIKKRYATEEAITGAPQRIEQICLDLVKHYETHIEPNGFKAQIVAVNRRTAILYKEILNKLNGPESAVIISSGHGDPPDWAPYRLSKSQQDSLIERFKKPMAEDKLSILIVCDMLLTGFDAPVEQVLYLDSPLKEHNLLQAIARVNRPANQKGYGLIVDYFGVSEFLKEALAIFNSEDVKGALTRLKDELPRLQTRHRAAMQFFEKVNRKDLNACIVVLEPEDVRARFEAAFHRFAVSMDMVMPDPVANPYREDLKFLGMVRNAARVRFRDESLNLAGCSEKVRKLIEEHIRSTGVDPLIAPVSILDKKFNEHLDEYKSDEAKASEMEHALRHEINERADEDPEFYRSLRERLERIIEARRQSRVAIAQTLNELRDLINEARNVRRTAERLGFDDETPFAFYGILKAEIGDIKGQNDLTELATQIVADLKQQSVIDWTEKSTVQKKMRSTVKRLLKTMGCPSERIEPLTLILLDLARVRLRR
jgi:type I restriction enzyme R subunit